MKFRSEEESSFVEELQRRVKIHSPAIISKMSRGMNRLKRSTFQDVHCDDGNMTRRNI